MRRWVLTVPLHDSAEVNAHLAKKTSEIRSLNLAYATADFEAIVQDLESFDQSSRSTRAMQRHSISLPMPPASKQQIEQWSQSENSLVEALGTKLRKRVTDNTEGEIDTLVAEAVGWFLERENAFEGLRSTAPELHEKLLAVITRRTTQLRLYGPPPQGHAHQILRDELEDLIADLRAEVPNFSQTSAHRVGLGTIADWLMRCPLDFPPYER
jgi:hypothetical protein